MRNDALEEFNSRVIEAAIAKLDIDKLATKLAKDIEKGVVAGFENMTENGFDFEYWLEEELRDEKTVAGKTFKKAIERIATKMAEAV